MNKRKIICALDVNERDEAVAITKRLAPHVGAFKIGHALTLNHGLEIVDQLKDVGAHRIFLDLKFHDIPNSVALAVHKAASKGVWMMTLHIAGGPAMMTAAVEEASRFSERDRPLLVGVSVLTSLDQHILTDYLGVQRKLEDHMVELSRQAIDFGLDGVVCSVHEARAIRRAIGGSGVIVTPGIRLSTGDLHDQRRTGDAGEAISAGADYLVIGRALIQSPDPEQALADLGLVSA